jgi:aryl-alcohol dehydrogenase-like predicted oxidoreductase
VPGRHPSGRQGRAGAARQPWPGATIPQVTLAWLLARWPTILPIPATTSINHLQENLDAQDLDLTPEDIQSIDSLVPPRSVPQANSTAAGSSARIGRYLA